MSLYSLSKQEVRNRSRSTIVWNGDPVGCGRWIFPPSTEVRYSSYSFNGIFSSQDLAMIHKVQYSSAWNFLVYLYCRRKIYLKPEQSLFGHGYAEESAENLGGNVYSQVRQLGEAIGGRAKRQVFRFWFLNRFFLSGVRMVPEAENRKHWLEI